MRFEITSKTTGETIPLTRDVSHTHPAWVHEQLGTDTEGQLQAYLDCYTADAIGAGPDSEGVSVTAWPTAEPPRETGARLD